MKKTKEFIDYEKSDNSNDNLNVLSQKHDEVSKINKNEELPTARDNSEPIQTLAEENPISNEYISNLREKLFKLQRNYNELREITQKLSKGIEYKLKSPSSTENDKSLRQTLAELSKKLTEFDNDVITLEVYKTRNRNESSDICVKKPENVLKILPTNETIPLVNITEYTSSAPSDYPSWLAIIKSQNTSPSRQLYEIPSKLEGDKHSECSDLSPVPIIKIDDSSQEMSNVLNPDELPASSHSEESIQADIAQRTNDVKESLISKNVQLMKKSTPTISSVPKPSSPFPEHITECNYFQLDYPKIICDLKVGPTYLKLRIFQALRWRLTHASIDMRKKLIKQYISNDIFGLMDNSKTKNTSSRFLSSLYFPRAHRTPHLIQQSIARLVNAVASLRIGRNYLTHDTSILQNILLKIVMPSERLRQDFNFDTITKEMVMATLQKFSLRNSQRLCMISEGLVEHLIKTLYEKAKYYSMYRLEYTTALLMNLCLHKEAQNRCALLMPTVIELMIQLLDSKFTPCLLYVNGAIYSLFMNQNILNYAKNAGIANLIKIRSKQCEGEVKQQLKFLYKFMTDSQFAKTKRVNEPSNHLEDEIDLIEPEIEMFDSLTNIYGPDMLVGEVLLHERYFKEVSTPTSMITEINDNKIEANESKEKLITQSTSTNDLLHQKAVSIQVNYLIDNRKTALNETNTDKTPENDNVHFPNENTAKVIYVTDQQMQTDDSDISIDQFTQTVLSQIDLSPNKQEEQIIHIKDQNILDRDGRKDNDIDLKETDIELNVLSDNKKQKNVHVKKHDYRQNERKHMDDNVIEKNMHIDNTLKEKEHKLSSKFKNKLKTKLSPLLDHNNVSFNEQTKQFYKKPTKLAIFERKKPHPPFTSTKPVTAKRNSTSASSTTNTFTVHTCQFYPDSKSPHSESSIYNPPYALDYYERWYPPMKNRCNCENNSVKPTESEMKLLNNCMNKDRRKFLPELFKDKPFRSEIKISSTLTNDGKNNNPYTHFSKNTCGNYSLLNFINIKTELRKEHRRNIPPTQATTATSTGGSSSRRKSDGLPKNPFKSRPKLPRTPPQLSSNGIF